MMYFLVAVMADRQCFAPFCYHHLLPGFFSFQIFSRHPSSARTYLPSFSSFRQSNSLFLCGNDNSISLKTIRLLAISLRKTFNTFLCFTYQHIFLLYFFQIFTDYCFRSLLKSFIICGCYDRFKICQPKIVIPIVIGFI